jgi:hypothetical protein
LPSIQLSDGPKSTESEQPSTIAATRRPKPAIDPLKHRPTAAVLDSVVRHRRDRLIFIATILDH